jgi:hypothetical protein
MADSPIFELRTYTANEGKLDELLARFRNHTLGIFESHGIQNVGYWVATEVPNTLVYVLKYAGDHRQLWADFQADPAWVAAKAASEANGPLVAHVESVFMTATDFSAIA